MGKSKPWGKTQAIGKTQQMEKPGKKRTLREYPCVEVIFWSFAQKCEISGADVIKNELHENTL